MSRLVACLSYAKTSLALLMGSHWMGMISENPTTRELLQLGPARSLSQDTRRPGQQRECHRIACTNLARTSGVNSPSSPTPNGHQADPFVNGFIRSSDPHGHAR